MTFFIHILMFMIFKNFVFCSQPSSVLHHIQNEFFPLTCHSPSYLVSIANVCLNTFSEYSTTEYTGCEGIRNPPLFTYNVNAEADATSLYFMKQ